MESCQISLTATIFPIKVTQLPIVGTVTYFLKSWGKLTSNPIILNIASGYEITLSVPKQLDSSKSNHLLMKKVELVHQQVKDMLGKGALRHEPHRGTISEFTVSFNKERWEKLPCCKLEGAAQEYTLSTFQNEGERYFCQRRRCNQAKNSAK